MSDAMAHLRLCVPSPTRTSSERLLPETLLVLPIAGVKSGSLPMVQAETLPVVQAKIPPGILDSLSSPLSQS